MNTILEMPARATKAVDWPTGVTYACDYHAEALQKIAASMGIHVATENCYDLDRQCTNCLNENSIVMGDADLKAARNEGARSCSSELQNDLKVA